MDQYAAVAKFLGASRTSKFSLRNWTS